MLVINVLVTWMRERLRGKAVVRVRCVKSKGWRRRALDLGVEVIDVR